MAFLIEIKKLFIYQSLEKLFKYGLGRTVLKVIEHYLNKRVHYVKSEQSSCYFSYYSLNMQNLERQTCTSVYYAQNHGFIYFVITLLFILKGIRKSGRVST